MAQYLPDNNLKYFLDTFLAARLMTVFFSCGIAFIVFHFSRALYGFLPALASLILYIFDPNILAHSQLVTTDTYVTGFLLLAIFSLWRYALSRNWKNALLLGVSLGLAQTAKYTAISYPFLAILSLLFYDLIRLWKKETKNWARIIPSYLWEYFKLSALILAISILILNIAYSFQDTFIPFGKYSFNSGLFLGIQKETPVLNTAPVPIPYAHLQGLDWTMRHLQTGVWHGNHYLLGNTRKPDGFLGYYIVAFLLKEPLVTQAFILLAFGTYFMDKERRESAQEIFLLIPIVFYFIYFNSFYNVQIGIRHYLIIFPLLFVFVGSFFSKIHKFSLKHKLALVFSFIYLVISLFSYFPYYIPYFNELVWERKNAYLYLADSNLDWGQGEGALQQYLEENPQAKYEPSKVDFGLIVISPNALVGVTEDPQKYAWLRENFEPVDTVAYEYLVYDISRSSFEEQCERTKFCK
jgi:4-amino-4-deoxy-L-arabinose transferase-like glycosyltransferase